MLSIYHNHPQIILPADAQVSLIPVEVSAVTHAALQQLLDTAQKVAEYFRLNYLTTAEKARQISLLNHPLDQTLSHLKSELNPQKYHYSRPESDQSTQAYLATSPEAHTDRHREKEYLVYDAFFRIYRAHLLDFKDFLYQFLETFQLCLLDLKYTEIPPDEFSHLLNLLSTVLIFGQDTLSPTHKSVSSPFTTRVAEEPELAFAAFWENKTCLLEEAEKTKLAFFRWFCGHQLWNSCLNLLSAYLSKTNLHLSQDTDEEVLIEQMTQIANLVRGFTSILWYTLNFPSYLYQAHISQAMENHSRAMDSNGLSGTQGQDFRQYKAAMQAFYQGLLEKYSSDLGAWPPEILQKLKALQNHEILFHEHHIILSHEKIDLNYHSILQRLSFEKKKSAPQVSAIDAMRDMRDLKRKKFKQILNQ